MGDEEEEEEEESCDAEWGTVVGVTQMLKKFALARQHSVGSVFTVAEQSGRHSRPAGSTWHAISSAAGTHAAEPAQPKHTSIGDQNNAKQTH
ncbi:hypothetical protein EYF80_010391 [Liparis tanakae]|uniref:Uncharacterized protein n=1 Tax=Liparis tanakae TaxID=230148 RepID=A0A4Z2INL7_9TELE|nr:hypothetical protein EYF80_010391 [Liparis tanakae]